MLITLQLVQSLALLAIAVLLFVRKPQNGRDGVDGKPGRDGVNGTPGWDGAAGAPGPPGKDGRDGRDGVDAIAASAQPTPAIGSPVESVPPVGKVRMVEILLNGTPWHRVPYGHPHHTEALTGRRGLSVKEL